jgi:hypothetical protein
MTKMDWERANQRDRMRRWRSERPRSAPLPSRPLKVPPKQCAGTTKAGLPCRGMAKAGHDLCGPHLNHQQAKRSIR